ncbi:MAG TPA: protein-L-isoaspartate O-methyltransferase [Candidatus Paceibacterota bacterium]|jgi:protein-L-isoaspartate(D-aspartate) O-methyltransferase|nr:protein-L-isoaspartate O-methyltransferase [Candidatus Paceibacterota bacterium]
MDRNDLNKHLKDNSDVLRNDGVKSAFEAVDRADFVGEDYKTEAYEDYALPLGHGQTITKPTIAAFMLELLDLQPGESVLEVGSGSGWMLALISEIIGKTGKAVGVEKIPELLDSARESFKKYDYAHTTMKQAGEAVGHAEAGPYDKILCTASADEIPHELVSQLKPEGAIVMPVKGKIVRAVKKLGKLEETAYPGEFHFEELS